MLICDVSVAKPRFVPWPPIEVFPILQMDLHLANQSESLIPESGHRRRNGKYSDRMEARKSRRPSSLCLRYFAACGCFLAERVRRTPHAHRLNHAFDHDPSCPLHNVDDLFSIRVRVRRPHRLAWLHLDDAHGAVLCVCILSRHDPAKTAARKIKRFDAVLVHNGERHWLGGSGQPANYLSAI